MLLKWVNPVMLLLVPNNLSIDCLFTVLFLKCSEEPDDFFEFTAEDYFRILATKKEGNTMHSSCDIKFSD